MKSFLSTVISVTLVAVSLSSIAAQPRLDLLGEAVSAPSSARTITINPDTKYVNVVGGETIKFVVGDKTFGWAFNGPVRSFDLARVAPAGVLNRHVMAYIATNPDDLGGSDAGGMGHSK
ncbi:CzcE family metal-binding protein [Glaciimonas soli]|uniref:CzcE family metal-binding protein n=1 Tax=Glaciimonas soli TaxID=2590999 RepID=A0A843YXC9_9BURK|nr:CzcE family metal-binding protein [Glaciimonas soli]MQR02128.1 CzcE family metal-binding protein [Glaciimonas soli]